MDSRIFYHQTINHMQDQIKKLIKNLDSKKRRLENKATRMLRNADVEDDIDDRGEYDETLGKAEILREVILKLKAL